MTHLKSRGRRRPEHARKAQFVIVAALLIAILVLGTALATSQLVQDRTQFRYKSAKELILGISSDFDRALGCALGQASGTYKEQGWEQGAPNAENNSRQTGHDFISTWTRSVLTAHSNLGVAISSIFNPLFDFQFHWESATGRSFAESNFGLNVTAYGMTGWTDIAQKRAQIALLPESLTYDETTNSSTFTFTLNREWDEAVPNLAPEDVKQLTVEYGNETWSTPSPPVEATIRDLEYLGNGSYRLSAEGKIHPYTRYVRLLVLTPDNIYVGCSHKATPTVTLKGRDATGNRTLDNIGELTLGGTPYGLMGEPSVSTRPGSYAISWQSSPGERLVFINWTTEGDIFTIDDTLYVGGNGNLTVFYQHGVDFRSREVEPGQTENLGFIFLDGISHSLPYGPVILTEGIHGLVYIPENSSYRFYNWTTEGTVSVDPNTRVTNLNVTGYGVVTAYYEAVGVSQEPPYVLIQSAEMTGSSVNLGFIDIANATWADTYAYLPAQYNLTDGGYSLNYTAHPDYVFDHWEWTPVTNISITIDTQQNTTLIVAGSGVVTAYYRYRFSSLELASRLEPPMGPENDNLGWISINWSVIWEQYDLPRTLDVRRGTYDLRYERENASFIFLRWEVPNSNLSVADVLDTLTQVTILGDGRLTAVYALLGGPSEYPVGHGWETIYVDAKNTVNPYDLWSQRDQKLHPYSTGENKQIVNLTSPTTPDIILADWVVVSLYLRPNPPQSIKNATVEMTFVTSDRSNWTIGSITLEGPLPPEQLRLVPIDTRNGIYPYGVTGYIPAGSTILVNVTVTFFPEYPWGSFFLYYGADRPSQIKLFDLVPLVLRATSTAGAPLQGVRFRVDGNPTGGFYATNASGMVQLVVPPGNHTVEVFDSYLPPDYLFKEWGEATWQNETLQTWPAGDMSLIVFARYGADVEALYEDGASP